MPATFIKRKGRDRRERPSLAPPISHSWPTERYVQRLSAPRSPRPEGEGWRKRGGPIEDKTWTSVWDNSRKCFVYGPVGGKVHTPPDNKWLGVKMEVCHG